MNEGYTETNTEQKETELTPLQEQLISLFRFGTQVAVARGDETFENDWIYFSTNGRNVRVAKRDGSGTKDVAIEDFLKLNAESVVLAD